MNLQFFPTPKPVISKLLEGLIASKTISGRSYPVKQFKSPILEPSAGMGHIADELSKRCESCEKINVIELDFARRAALHEKGYRVLDSDFLSYNETQFGLIVMNPPFNKGIEHLLHAWELLLPGGMVRCLLNANSVADRERNSKTKALRALIDQYGNCEDLGQPFKGAEIPTDVEVVLVTLAKPEQLYEFQASLGRMEQDDLNSEEYISNPLARRNMIESLVASYDLAVNALKERYLSQQKLNWALDSLNNKRHIDRSLTAPVTFDEALQAIKRSFWSEVFDRTQLAAMATSAFKSKWDEFVRQQQCMAFNVVNVLECLDLFFQTRDQVMLDSAQQVFDKGCSFSDKNPIHYFSRKSNKHWKWGRRIIIPNAVKYDSKTGWWFGSYHCPKTVNFLTDLEKVLCYLLGKSYGDLPGKVEDVMRDGFWKRDYRQIIESYFFDIRVFKVGTMHIYFKDVKLLELFNRTVAKGRNWIADESSEPKKTKNSNKFNSNADKANKISYRDLQKYLRAKGSQINLKQKYEVLYQEYSLLVDSI
ncbi:MAG: DUF4942 domain-containing protein [Oscillatoria sp. SIO1A7]|nr:DUF4942 domain-containing protein [Oscillatoria sp. SIO1A7]